MEMGEVVETSFHRINGNHGKVGFGSILSAQSPPISGCSCKAHTDPNLCLIEECMYRLKKEDVDTNL